MVFVVKEIGNLFLALFKSQSALAAVAGDKAPAASKLIDGEDAVIVAALAPPHGGGVF